MNPPSSPASDGKSPAPDEKSSAPDGKSFAQRSIDSHAIPELSSRRIRRKLILAVLVVVSGCVILAVSKWQRSAVEFTVRPPVVDLTDAADGVRASILTASDAVMKSPESAATWGKLGMVFFAHQLDAEAAICFQHAVNRDATEFRWTYLLALALTATEHDRAIELLRRSLELRPDVAIAHARLGELLIDDGATADAAWHLQRAVRLAPADPRPHLALARIALQNGQLQQAQESAVTATQLAPDSRSAFEVLARTLAQAGQKENADEALGKSETLRDEPISWRDPFAEDVLSLRSDSADVIAVAEQLFAAGRTADAISHLRRNLSADFADPQLGLKLAEKYLATGQIPQAQELLSAVIARFPRNATGHFLNGVARLMSDRPDEAVTCFQSALELKPDYAMARYNLGQARLRQGDDAAALEQFRIATRLDPKMSEARINVARLLLKSGDTPGAISEFRTTLRYDPSDAEAAKSLRQLER